MILQALVEYYEAFEWKGKITSSDWYRAKVTYGPDILEQEELRNVIPFRQERWKSKKTAMVSQDLMVPQMISRSSGVSAGSLCDHSGHMLGIGNKGKSERSRKCFECAKKEHKDILEHINSLAARAVCRFFNRWAPDQMAENPYLVPELEGIISSPNLVFMMGGEYTHEDPDIGQCWKEYGHQSSTEPVGVCLVIGHRGEIARIHGAIKGAQEAQSSGAALVSFNAPAFESYDKEQSFNAPVGTYAAHVYTTALSYFLGDRTHGTTIGDTTVVYWSEEGDERYQSIFAYVSESTMENQEIVDGVFKNLIEEKAVTAQGIQGSLDMDRKFYILGLTPNAARLAVRFFYQDSFGNILKHIEERYSRVEIMRPIADAVEYLGVWRMLQETAGEKSRDEKPVPSMSGVVHRAIISGSRYPASLYQAVLDRIRVEQDDGDSRIYKITRGRVVIIKTHLLKSRNEKKEITMAPDEDSNNTAYILGGELVVLEAIQEDANPGISATIKDKYFNSACTVPVAILLILFKLGNSHVKKMNNGAKRIYYERILGDLQGRLTVAKGQRTVCPGRPTLEEQGMFILGYYHQTQKRYEEKIEEKA